jgi:2-polyprenyl-3-methyl-5-hydroxy-6-metoxy-1,4-benzoquinol methylase
VQSRATGAECAVCDRVFPEADGILDMTVGRSGAPGYDPHFYEILGTAEDEHFWFASRRQVVLGVMRQTISDLASRSLFDIGCGTGSLLEFLSRNGVAVLGACDAYSEGLGLVRRRLDIPLILVDEGRPAPLGPGFGLLGMFDVLEHIENDTEVLAQIRGALEPGGVLVLTVPAHPSLFGPSDVAAHHKRRYTRRELREKLLEAGFEVRLLSHFMMPLAPVLFVLEKARRLFSPAASGSTSGKGRFAVVPLLNGLLRRAFGVERMLMGLGPLPFGSSLVAVASRPSAR